MLIKRFISLIKRDNKEKEQTTSTETDTRMGQDLNRIMEEYGQYEWKYLKNKEELQALRGLDVMAYAICWPGAQGSPGSAFFITNRGLAYVAGYCYGETTYDDIREILPNLPKDFEDLRPWEVWNKYHFPQETNKELKVIEPWDIEGYHSIDGWYWYGLHSGCWARIHESIWPTFYNLARHNFDLWIARCWGAFARKAIADREEQLEAYLATLEGPDMIHEGTNEEAREVAKMGIVAWRESDQGWGGLLCKNGKAYYKLNLSFDTLDIPINKRLEIRNDSIPGWRCIYCGLGHRLMIREEYYPSFRELTYGMGKNANLYTYGFNILANIIKRAK